MGINTGAGSFETTGFSRPSVASVPGSAGTEAVAGGNNVSTFTQLADLYGGDNLNPQSSLFNPYGTMAASPQMQDPISQSEADYSQINGKDYLYYGQEKPDGGHIRASGGKQARRSEGVEIPAAGGTEVACPFEEAVVVAMGGPSDKKANNDTIGNWVTLLSVVEGKPVLTTFSQLSNDSEIFDLRNSSESLEPGKNQEKSSVLHKSLEENEWTVLDPEKVEQYVNGTLEVPEELRLTKGSPIGKVMSKEDREGGGNPRFRGPEPGDHLGMKMEMLVPVGAEGGFEAAMDEEAKALGLQEREYGEDDGTWKILNGHSDPADSKVELQPVSIDPGHFFDSIPVSVDMEGQSA